MGLDTTHGCWNGPYSSFMRFRKSLCQQIGVDIDSFSDYGGTGPLYSGMIKHDIMPLIYHSDCDGELTPDECKRIVNGLNDILDNFNEDIEADYNFKDKIIKFRDGCLKAIELNENVEFY